MHYQALVLDIDGTLYNSEKRITAATREAIFRAREAGKVIAIASGRPLPGVLAAAAELRFAEKGGYLMAYNGGRIFNAKTGEIIRDVRLPSEMIPRIAALAKSHGVAVVGHAQDELVTESPHDGLIQYEARLNQMSVTAIPSLAAYRRKRLYKCLITGEAERLAELEQIALREFAGELSVFRSEPYFLEILPRGVDKGGAIDILATHLGISKDEVIACGDGFNDLSMICHAGLGVAMSNAQPDVKASADYITASCDEDGLVPVIERFLMAG
ncbi:MAG: HAD family phosphatase [Clostridia bacterium]|nr:HAD family phosphatase [Clostridia bacterium]MBQ1554875.1 HAD family phosphatase [Clostridia bacterium]